MANILKDLKPLSFGGEEKEWTKDAVNMFLHKWGDIHSLRRNPEVVKPIEASLLLKVKACKDLKPLSFGGEEKEQLKDVI